MILPTKHIVAPQSLLGIGAAVLQLIDRDVTITGLWERARLNPDIGTFDRFVLALDLLYAMDLVELTDGLLRRVTR